MKIGVNLINFGPGANPGGARPGRASSKTRAFTC